MQLPPAARPDQPVAGQNLKHLIPSGAFAAGGQSRCPERSSSSLICDSDPGRDGRATVAISSSRDWSAARGLQNTRARSGGTCQKVSRPHRPRDKVASAVRAAHAQDIGRTIRAERAFKGADESLTACRRQVAITALAIGPQFQHVILLILSITGAYSSRPWFSTIRIYRCARNRVDQASSSFFINKSQRLC
jgi:hypothetical protein